MAEHITNFPFPHNIEDFESTRIYLEELYTAIQDDVSLRIDQNVGGALSTSGAPVANDIAVFSASNVIGGRSYAEIKSDLDLEIGTDILAQQTIGIADNNLVEVDGSPSANHIAQWTASGLTGVTTAAHNKAVHDALNIDADTLDSHDSAYFSAATHLHDTDTLQLDGITSDGGEFAFTTSDSVIFKLSSITGTDNQVVEIIGGEALDASEHWTGLRIKPDALDPGGADTRIRGIAINVSGVDPGAYNMDLDALRIIMPTTSVQDAIRIKGGKIRYLYTPNTDALAEYSGFDIVIDATNQDSTSETHAIDIALANGLTGDAVAVGTHFGIDPIHQHIGTYENITLDALYIDGTGYASFTDENIWGANGDALCVGHTAKFDEIELVFDTVATKDVFLRFYYWKDASPDAWTRFYPGDNTDGGRQNGIIRFDGSDLTDWLSADPTGQGAGYWIKIERNRVNDPGTVNLSTHKYLISVTYYWNKSGNLSVGTVGCGAVTSTGLVRGDGGFSDGANAGIDTTFLDNDGNTITVNGGIITSKVAP